MSRLKEPESSEGTASRDARGVARIEAPGWFERLGVALTRLAEAGTGGYPAETKRRLMILNMIAYLIVVTTLIYGLQQAMLDYLRYWPIVAINAAIVVIVAAVPFMHRFGSEAAALLILVTEYAALLAFVYFLGRESGLHIQYVAFSAGAFVVQEEGAQWAALALGARPGERVLDACAGHGQKSSLLAEQLLPDGELYVNDITESKLLRLRREFERLGLPAPSSHRVDLGQGLGDVPKGMDRVLVDAPCTGTGTLRRRPEIARRLRPEDPRRLADQAVALLTNAARAARPGGRVLFVVCSVLRTECEDVAERVLGTLAPAPFDTPAAVRVAGEGVWQYRLLPSLHGTDGYYVASFTPRG